MNRNSLLTVGAALTIAGAAVVGGYFVDRMPSQSVQLASADAPHSVVVPPPAVKHSIKQSASVAVNTPSTAPTPTMKPATPTLLREAVADRALVAVSGTVMDKKGDVLTLKEASGPLRVVMREDTPRPREMGMSVRAVDKIDVGAPVTVYGRLRTNDPSVTKLYADAVYDPSTKTLYQLNGDTPAEQLTSAAITARYMPVGNAHVTKVTTTKLTNTNVVTQR